MNEDTAAVVETEVSSLASSFLKRTQADLLRLGQMIASARQGETSVLQEIATLSHTIRGSAAMFGYRGISAAAGSLEACVSQAAASISIAGATIDDARLEPVLAFMRQLAQETDEAGRTAN